MRAGASGTGITIVATLSVAFGFCLNFAHAQEWHSDAGEPTAATYGLLSDIGEEALEPCSPLRHGQGDESEEAEEPLETERDAFTPRTITLKRGVFVTESSYSFVDTKVGEHKHSFPELLLRYGLTDRVELRLGWNKEQGGGQIDTVGSFGGTGGETLLYGIKLNTTRQDRWIPESSLILQGESPTDTRQSDTRFNMAYVFGWKLPNEWKIDSALRFLTDSEGEDHYNLWAPSVVLRIPVLTDRTHTHFEYFGLFSDQQAQNTNRQFLSAGIAHDITPNFEIGFRAGVGLNEQSANYFTNVGFGLRF